MKKRMRIVCRVNRVRVNMITWWSGKRVKINLLQSERKLSVVD